MTGPRHRRHGRHRILDVRRLADEAGDVDILVNNAGIYGASKAALELLTTL